MITPRYHRVADGIYCIDALYTAPELACCYLLSSAGEYAVIETGTARSVPNVMATLKDLGVPPDAVRFIIPTHVHLDHAGGAGMLMGELPQATLLIHPRGARHMIDPGRLVASAQAVYGEDRFRAQFGEILPVPAARLRMLDDGEHVDIGSRRLRVRHTRGHAEHHFCLFDEETQGWFSGDMFGVSYPALRFGDRAFVMPATTPTQFDPVAYAASVDLLAEAQPRSLYLTHFSALPFRTEQATYLKRQLQAYAALRDEAEPDAASLRARVLDITQSSLAELIGDSESGHITATLTMDAQLNAQGIAWWIAQGRR